MKQKSPISFWAVIALIILLLGILFLIKSILVKPTPTVTEAPEATPTYPTAEEIATTFIEAKTIEEKLPLLRPVDELEDKVAAYFEAYGEVDVDPSPVKRMPDEKSLGMRIHRFYVEYPDERRRLISVVDTSDGPKVDFETFARWGETTWPELVNGQTEGAFQMRAFIGRYKPNDEDGQSAYFLSTPDYKEKIVAFADKKNRSVIHEFDQLFQRPKRVTLLLESEVSEGGEPRILINKIEAMGWTRLDEDFEGIAAINLKIKKNRKTEEENKRLSRPVSD